jgi:acetyl-CoA C-acetyltransferase
MKKAVLIDAVRTPIGKFGGSLRNVNAEDLSALTIKAILRRTGIPSSLVNTVAMGQVRMSSQANNLARVALLKAEVSVDANAYTINMLCGSGMKAIICGASEIMLGQSEAVIAGGAENMSQTPFYIRNARFGDKSPEFVDANVEGGLGAVPREIYGNELGMGITAENVARAYDISREDQDQFAYESQIKYSKALAEGKFRDELVPVEVTEKKKTFVVEQDEFPRPDTTLESLAKLRPVFRKDGSVTAGNSCGINDGASSVFLLSEEKAHEFDAKPVAKLIGWGEHGVDPLYMGIGPISATKKALKHAGIDIADLGLVELNEAFASQSLACIRELGLDKAKTNVNGGAIALGHPLGCTGARIVTTLVHEMKRRGVRYGLATQCIGGGQGIATVWELVE